MGKLPTQKKILREDIKDPPSWINSVIDPVNSFMESVYQVLNKNVSLDENLASFTKELIYRTPSTYPAMANVEFMNTLKTKAKGVILMQAIERANYTPVLDAVYVPWVEDNGTIVISPITGLAADMTYVIRLLVV